MAQEVAVDGAGRWGQWVSGAGGWGGWRRWMGWMVQVRFDGGDLHR